MVVSLGRRRSSGLCADMLGKILSRLTVLSWLRFSSLSRSINSFLTYNTILSTKKL